MVMRYSLLIASLTLTGCALQPPGVEKIAHQSVGNLMYIGEGIYSGAAPTAASFAALQEMGVNTLVCVDSAKPEVELAAKHGMDYVHIPINYDQIDEHALLSIKRLILERPDDIIYVHCHHGKHRGPAVAAVALRQRGDVSTDAAAKVLEVAGTSLDYPGLWRDVRGWQDPQASEMPELHSIAPIESFAAGMAQLDRNWDRIKLLQKNSWQVPASHPDLVVVNEARQTRDLLTDCKKELPIELADDADFKRRMDESVVLSEELYSALVNKKSEAVELSYKELKSSCVYCHRKYRND
jgi:protein tyrosine phosphatase (PTP) superfamily phosphohydrolase (DUF442 family)